MMMMSDSSLNVRVLNEKALMDLAYLRISRGHGILDARVICIGPGRETRHI